MKGYGATIVGLIAVMAIGRFFLVEHLQSETTESVTNLISQPPRVANDDYAIQHADPNLSREVIGKQVFHWIDAHNSVHYSDALPDTYLNATRLRALEIQPAEVESIDQAAIPPASTEVGSIEKPVSEFVHVEPSYKIVNNSSKDSHLCAQDSEALNKLRERMRHGYSARESPRLLEEERKLDDLIHKHC
jgi:hypothetical protein